METRFIFVRHGQSEGNAKRVFLGTTDLPLTELGERQASLTAKYLKNEKIDAIYSSPLVRAYRTAEYIAEEKDLSIITDSAFTEAYAGVWEGMTFDSIYENYDKEIRDWRERIGVSACPEGESFESVYNRVIPEIFRLSKIYEGQTVLVATHATPMRAIFTACEGKTAREATSPKSPPNASVTYVTVKDGKMIMKTYGYSEHLGDIVTELPKNV